MKPLTEEHLSTLRRHMVEVIDIEFDVLSSELGTSRMDERVRAALLKVPRHRFVPQQLAAVAYHDTPLPIGFDKTISQPFIVALMTDLLRAQPTDVVLEVGTGLGYQTAILAELVGHVWSMEVVEEFAAQAGAQLDELGYGNVTLRVGNGSRGWSDAGPFDAILVTAAAKQTPAPLIEQLKVGGRLVIPLGEQGNQRLSIIEREAEDRLTMREVLPVQFTELETVI